MLFVLPSLISAVVLGVRRTFHNNNAPPIATKVNAPSEPVSCAVSRKMGVINAEKKIDMPLRAMPKPSVTPECLITPTSSSAKPNDSGCAIHNTFHRYHCPYHMLNRNNPPFTPKKTAGTSSHASRAYSAAI